MTNEIVIRDAVQADLAGLAAIRYADRPAIHRDRIRDANGQGMRYLVSERHNRILGFGLLLLERPPLWSDSEEKAYFPVMIDLFTAEPYRSQGIGTALIHTMEQLVRQHGGTELYLSVEPMANPKATVLYSRLGYQPLQAEPYRSTWRFIDSDGIVHEGEEWIINMVKHLM